MSIKTTNEIEVYEQNGSECKGLRSDKPFLIIKDHWNRKDFVVLVIDEKSVTILARDLIAAVNNSINAHT